MSEWASFFAVFWALWAADGTRVVRRAMFFADGGRRRGSLHYGRFAWPGISALRWRIVAPDVPLAFSPAGIVNRPAGCAGRPAEAPAVARTWRWDEVRQVGVARGWIFINGERFCPDTGHLMAPIILELAQLRSPDRERRICALLAQWCRPIHLRRRARVLTARTRMPAMLNVIITLLALALTTYVGVDVPSYLSDSQAQRIAGLLPAFVAAGFVLHVSAVLIAWRATRRLKPVRPEKRGTNLFSALLLPPQGLRLRALVSEGFFPAQHPLALALAFGSPAAQRELAFNTLTDLRHPLPQPHDPALGHEVSAWFGEALAARLQPLLAAAKIDAEALLAAPKADSPASCAYCPRCNDQFAHREGRCPHGIRLQPLEKRSAASERAATNH